MRQVAATTEVRVQRIDVTEGLQSTLVMLGHRLREGGVTVVRDYCSEVPEVEAYPGELNQVWTNLIDNAVDAMQGQGTLTIRTQVSPEVPLSQASSGRAELRFVCTQAKPRPGD